MQVGVVAVPMPQRCVHMRMRMRLAAIPGKVVPVLVMRVVQMRVCMCQRLVAVLVIVLLEQV